MSYSKRFHPMGMAIVWLVVIGILYAVAHWYLQPPTAHITAQGDLILTRDRDGHFYADGAVNGVPVRFLVDTGASVVSISEQVATQAGLQGGRAVTFQTANGPRAGHMIRAEEVRVGASVVRDLMVGTGYTAGQQHQGLLGQNFLAHFEVRMDRERLEMRAKRR